MAAETIIESFCERCGTRYAFEPVRKRESKLVGIGKSLGILLDSPAAALAARDPFHGTFHFCLECRQYTCPNCWNEAAGFCQGCVPLPESQDTAALDAAEAEATSSMNLASAEHTALSTPEVWPDADLLRLRMEALQQGLPDPLRSDLPEGSLGPDPVEDDSWSMTFEPGLAVALSGVAEDAPAQPAVAPGDAVALEAEPVADDGLGDVPAPLAAAAFGVTGPVVSIGHDATPDAADDAALDDPAAALGVESVTAVETPAELAIGSDDAAPERIEADEALAAPAAEGSAAATQADASTTAEEPPAASVMADPDSGAAVPDDDTEADWADLMARLAAGDDEPLGDDWSTMAPALGPDVAPAPTPSSLPASTSPAVIPPAPLTPAVAWQLTAPAAEGETRPTAWPPLGPVFRPAPSPAPAPATPHPSVLTARPANRAVLARGQGQAAAPTPLPNGVRPCVSCELPLSASARFCRRCGHPQS